MDTSWKINKDWKSVFLSLQEKKPTNEEVDSGQVVNCYYSPRKKMSQMILTTFIQGSSGYLYNIDEVKAPKKGISVAFGKDTIHNIIKPCLKERLPLIYIDHAYFDRGYKNKTDIHKTPPNFRIIKDNIHLSKLIDRPDDRFKTFGIKLRKWKKTGNHILICPPTGYLEEVSNLSSTWFEDTIAIIRANTDRKILIRPKPGITAIEKYHKAAKKIKNVEVLENRPLAIDLLDCWAIAAPASGVLIEAAIYGIPIFCEPISPAASIGLFDYSQIESPIYPDRRNLMNNLAYSQFNLFEIQSGLAFRILNEV